MSKALKKNKTPLIRDYIHRQSFLGLLFAQVGAILLHVQRLPVWLILLSLVVFIWRIQIYRGQWHFPSRIIRSCLVLCSVLSVIGYYREWYALEPMVTLLIMAFLLKLLEVERKRDAVVLIFVGFFVSATAFLFNQGIIITFLGIIVIWALVACLMVLHGSESRYLSRRTFRTVSTILLQSIPIMLIMLFVFPRIGALWSVPLKSSSTVTGVSDRMSPGEFSNLTRSRALAFRVSFENNQVPSQSELYWRGVVLTQFDGRNWERQPFDYSFLKGAIPQTSYNLSKDVAKNKKNYRYEVVLEATSTDWIYAIPYADVITENEQNNLDERVLRSPTNELIAKTPVTQRIKYRVESTTTYITEEAAENVRRAQLLPKGYNPKTIQQARAWRSEVGSTEAYITRILSFYHQNFTYTLSPPKLGLHTADEFLFETQRGFCEHFASSFVILMRAAGIPARVVTGYQGGEWNNEDNYLLVRQYDAHAWAEVWFQGKGWIRVDPTAAVAPNRIEQGILDTLTESEQDLLDPTTLPSFAWINRLALKWDSLNYRWQRWVLSYDQEKQSQWLKDLLGEVTAVRMAILLLLPSALMLLLFFIMTLYQKRIPVSQKVKLYQVLKNKLSRRGIVVKEGMTFSQLFSEAIAATPEKKVVLLGLKKEFDKMFYQDDRVLSVEEKNRIRRIIKTL